MVRAQGRPHHPTVVAVSEVANTRAASPVCTLSQSK